MMSRFVNSIFFTREKSMSLRKIRIVKTNLIHVQGFPKSLAKDDILKSPEYFGQYGTIESLILSEKTNPDTNRKSYSAYITYSNKIEASLAVLCVDSLMIKGKIIRVFFGTTKYCDYFLNNIRCPNSDKCFFLHQFASDRDIIIEPKTVFTYSDHLNLAKQILQIYNPCTRNFLKNMKKPEKNVFPSTDFIYMTEEEKENHLSQGNLSYVKGKNKDLENSKFFKNNIKNDNNNFNFGANVSRNVSNDSEGDKKFLKNSDDSIDTPNDNISLHEIFGNSIKYILTLKPFLNKMDNKSVKKMEFVYMKNDLKKKGLNVDKLLDGCLDCMKDIL